MKSARQYRLRLPVKGEIPMPKPDKQPPSNHVVPAPTGTVAWHVLELRAAGTLGAQWGIAGPFRVAAVSVPDPSAPRAQQPVQRDNLQLAADSVAVPQAFVLSPNGARWYFLNAADAPDPALVAHLTPEAAQEAAQLAERAALLARIGARTTPSVEQARA